MLPSNLGMNPMGMPYFKFNMLMPPFNSISMVIELYNVYKYMVKLPIKIYFCNLHSLRF